MEKERTKWKTRMSRREFGTKMLLYTKHLQMLRNLGKGYIRIEEIPYQKRGIYTGEEDYKEFTIEIRLPSQVKNKK